MQLQLFVISDEMLTWRATNWQHTKILYDSKENWMKMEFVVNQKLQFLFLGYIVIAFYGGLIQTKNERWIVFVVWFLYLDTQIFVLP